MDYNVGDPAEFVPKQGPRSCGKIVRILNGHLGANLQMKLDMILEPVLRA